MAWGALRPARASPGPRPAHGLVRRLAQSQWAVAPPWQPDGARPARETSDRAMTPPRRSSSTSRGPRAGTRSRSAYLFERGGLDLDKPALVFEGEERTYGEVRDRARRVANGLDRASGSSRWTGSPCWRRNRLEFIEIEAGIAAARAIMVPLNWRLRASELANLLRRSRARAIFVEERVPRTTVLELRRSGEVPDLRTVIALDGGAADLGYERAVLSSSPERPTTSAAGSTTRTRSSSPRGPRANPKGVVWTNGTVLWNSLQQVMDFQLGPALVDLHRSSTCTTSEAATTSRGRSSTRAARSTSSARAASTPRRSWRYVAEHAHHPRAVGADDALRDPAAPDARRLRHERAADDHVRRPARLGRHHRARAGRIPAHGLHPGLRPHRGRRGGRPSSAPHDARRQARIGRPRRHARRAPPGRRRTAATSRPAPTARSSSAPPR